MSLLRNMMLGAGVSAALMLAACASSDPAPAPAAPAPPPPPMADVAPAPAGAGVAAPGVFVPPPTPPRQNAGDIVVPGGAESPVPPPSGDTRSDSERMRDIRAWDRCVTRAQSMGESDPMRPQMDSPEELCSRSLGMAGRTAVPDSRRP